MLSNKQIAWELKLLALKSNPYWKYENQFTVRIDDMVIKCKPTQEAILALALKFEKARPHYTMKSPRPPTNKQSRFSLSMLRRFQSAGEYENAENYAALHNMAFYQGYLCRRGKGEFAQWYENLRKRWATSRFLNVEVDFQS
ncbi:MAG: hypothetical protein DRQ48_01880 [Gammaproteobacteria bacterium]|nr:MAG: hypothetical protein DRQ48_01880 [Gammaproteobacteria bacterium]